MRRILVGLSVGLLASASVAQITMSAYVDTFTNTMTRGYFFQAPLDFEVTELQVPDEQYFGEYMVALYKLTAAPPAFGSTVAAKPVFYAGGVKSHTCVKVPTFAGTFKKGEWVAVLGGCGYEIGGIVRNSYGAKLGSGNPSAILGIPIVAGLQRFGMQLNIGPTKGVGPVWSEVKGSIGRVRMTVRTSGAASTKGAGSCDFCPPSNGNASLVVLSTHPAIIGKELKLEMRSGPTANLGALLAYGLVRGDIPIPGFGRLCLLSISGIMPVGPGPIPNSLRGKVVSIGTVPTATPVGITLIFQGALVTAPTEIPLTNGLEIVTGR